MEPNALRIDWFDGSVVEGEPVSTPEPAPPPVALAPPSERKLLGFRRLQDLARAEAESAVLTLCGRTSFWELLNTQLKPDFVVLVASVLGKISAGGTAALGRLLLEKTLHSRFLDTLAEYTSGLPNTRISEKNTNMQFWEEPSGFYISVLVFCRHMCAELPERAKDTVMPLLDIVRASVDGVMLEHREAFSDVVFQMIENVQNDLEKIPNNDMKSSIHSLVQKVVIGRPEFRTMSIFPLHEDVTRERQCAIEGNLINGAYADVEHYLDVQFRLMREDYIAPLRNGILKYLQDPSKHRHENIRVHPVVFFLRTHVVNNRVGYLLGLTGKDSSGTDYNSPGSRKHLMFGSLLLFTCDNFETIVCGTVLDSSSTLLKDGLIVVTLHNTPPVTLFSEKFLMVESEVYFEPYHRVLKVLQEIEIEDFPVKEYIINVQPITKHPTYLTKETKYKLVEGSEELFVSILQDECWPSSHDLALDDSQYEAYKFALTKEFAVIQGPPGTGKTYIGVRVARTILSNLALAGSPMLVICYTNHALDQFLEEILNITTDVVRLGSQSKSEKLELYSISNVRARSQSKHSYVYSAKRRQQESIMRRMTDVQDGIERCDNEILAYKSVKPFLEIGNKTYNLDRDTTEDPVSAWLFGHLNDKTAKPSGTADEVHEDVLHSWDEDETLVLESCFSVEWALKEIQSMETSIKYVNDITTDINEAKLIVGNFESGIRNLRKKINYFECYFSRHKCDHLRHVPVKEVKNLDVLSVQERWALYFSAVTKIKGNLIVDMTKLENEHRECTLQIEEVRLLVDVESVRHARVLGATTTAAARAHALVRALKSHIVIVEEAAEVLEGHIVASLTQHCQHLILIGDHQQLRPTASDYQLARTSNLEVSLFERMISNGVHSRTLNTQHRMSPQILRLIAPAVYPELRSHECVLELPEVRGMKSRLWFLNHREFEDDMGKEGWSHRSQLEARWSIALAEHLRRQDYSPEDIVLLTTYTAQADLIRQISKERPLLTGIRITVVDNYQGEESKIVILSLVRSNREGNIGFLAISNRVCVALSRAREGLYIIGNLGLLSQKSSLWGRVREVLEEERAVGDAFVLQCPNHPAVFITVSSPDEWAERSALGGCGERCGAELACGHRCTARCHGYDGQHRTFVCDAPCPRLCTNGHDCPLRCGEPCGPCSVRMVRNLPCGHRQESLCSARDGSPICLAVVSATLPQCGHQIEKNCYLELRKVKCRVCVQSGQARLAER